MLQRLARFILRVGGWTMVGGMPDEPKAVIIAAPHTSNWDGFWALTYAVAIDADVHFFAKQSLFWFPLGALLRALGGIPLDRGHAGSAVQQAIDRFDDQDGFCFGLAPEGTREKTEGWKTGFYRIAEGANVPVFFGMLDFGQRRIGIDGRLDISGNQEADLDVCRAFYKDVRGRWPEKASPIRFTTRA